MRNRERGGEGERWCEKASVKIIIMKGTERERNSEEIRITRKKKK